MGKIKDLKVNINVDKSTIDTYCNKCESKISSDALEDINIDTKEAMITTLVKVNDHRCHKKKEQKAKRKKTANTKP